MPSKISYLFAVVALALALPLSLSFAFDAHGQSVEQNLQSAEKLFKVKDYKAALPLLRQAAKQGSVDGMLLLAILHEVGCGTPQDWAKSDQWYRQAAKLGNREAKENLEMYKKDTSKLMRGMMVKLAQKSMSC